MAYSNTTTKRSRFATLKKPKVFVPLLLILTVVTLLVLELTNTTYLFHKKVAVSSDIPATTTQDSNSSDKNKSKSQNSANKTDTTQTSEKTVNPPTSGSNLIAPSGSFASSHKPSLSNGSGMESVCITTPGASCTITFTLDNAVKTLTSKQTDGTGAVIWNWDLNEAGFTTGSWQITATATLDGQSKSTTDIQKLEVQP